MTGPQRKSPPKQPMFGVGTEMNPARGPDQVTVITANGMTTMTADYAIECATLMLRAAQACKGIKIP